MKRVAVFTGTRAEYGLLYWLLKDMQADEAVQLQLLVSGSHLSPEFGNTFQQIEADGFVIDEKVEMLLSSDSPAGVAKSVGLGVLGFTDSLSRLDPDCLVVLGDRFEALAVVQTAALLGIPVVHLHGGEITEGAFDDAIRHAITKFSQLHCVAAESYRQRVIQLGEAPATVFNVGAAGLDHFRRSQIMPLPALSASLDFELRAPFFLLTYHPATLGDENPQQVFKAILDAVEDVPGHQLLVTYPNADNGGREIINMIERHAQTSPERVCAVPSLGQKRYISALTHAAVVIGNSSSGIIEAPTAGVPTVNIGCRQQGRLSAKSVLHCSVAKEDIVASIKLALKDRADLVLEASNNPYGQGDTSGKVLELIKTADFSKVKTFHDLPRAGA